MLPFSPAMIYSNSTKFDRANIDAPDNYHGVICPSTGQIVFFDYIIDPFVENLPFPAGFLYHILLSYYSNRRLKFEMFDAILMDPVSYALMMAKNKYNTILGKVGQDSQKEFNKIYHTHVQIINPKGGDIWKTM